MTKLPTANDEFISLITRVVDETLSSLGEAPKTAVYQHIEKVFNLSKSENPARIDEFSNALEDLFGLGARILEIKIIQNLHSQVGVVWEMEAPNSLSLPDLTLKQYSDLVKKHLEHMFRYGIEIGMLLKEDEALEKYR